MTTSIDTQIVDAIRNFCATTGKQPSYLYLGDTQREELGLFVHKFGVYPGGGATNIHGTRPKIHGLTMLLVNDPNHLRVS